MFAPGTPEMDTPFIGGGSDDCDPGLWSPTACSPLHESRCQNGKDELPYTDMVQRLPFPAPAHAVHRFDQPSRWQPSAPRGSGVPGYPILNRWKVLTAMEEKPTGNRDKLARICVMLTLKLIKSLRHLVPLIKETEGKEEKVEEGMEGRGKAEDVKARKDMQKGSKGSDDKDEEDQSATDEKGHSGGKEASAEKSFRTLILDPILGILCTFFHTLLDEQIVNIIYDIGSTLTTTSEKDQQLVTIVKHMDKHVEELIEKELKVGEMITKWKSEADKAKKKGEELKVIKKENSMGFYQIKLRRKVVLGAVSAFAAPLAVLSALAADTDTKTRIILGGCATGFALIAASVGVYLYRRAMAMKVLAKKIANKDKKQKARAENYSAGVECLNNFLEIEKVFKQRLVSINMRLKMLLQSPGDEARGESVFDRCEQLLHAIAQVSREIRMVPEIELEYDDNLTSIIIL